MRKIPACGWLVLDMFLFVLVQSLANVEFRMLKVIRLGMIFVLHVVGAVMAFVVPQKIAEKINWNNAMVAFLAKRSMAVYLIHQQVIYFFIYLLNGKVGIALNVMLIFYGGNGYFTLSGIYLDEI